MGSIHAMRAQLSVNMSEGFLVWESKIWLQHLKTLEPTRHHQKKIMELNLSVNMSEGYLVWDLRKEYLTAIAKFDSKL